MRTEALIRGLAAAAIASVLTACASPGSGPFELGGRVSPPFDAAAIPACPPVGAVVRQGKATAKNVLVRTVAGAFVVGVQWKIVFTNLTESQTFPRYAFRSVAACGQGAFARGKIGNGGSYHQQRSCSNGTCTVTETIGVAYVPPKKILPNFFRYDTIRFAPDKPAPGYGPMIGALVQIKKTP